MEAEDDILRPVPARPYKPVEAQLRVPADATKATLDLLQRAGKRESGLFWYGTRDLNGNGHVHYVAAPKQQMTWGNYHVSPQALAEIVHRLPDGWKPLAQIHSHPGSRVEHSNYDDRMMSSRKSLSLVFPFYGKATAPFPSGVGIHEWQIDYWHLLDDTSAARRVIVTGGSVTVEDLR
ncbi:Mov34/MPN/PAD-1 family protein [Bradyrhizobium sp. 147]|uniref:Mov34/MPN/PAD-1 family protein n=1 Tax=Bradyrhizobium sp. 147 TaxID=2782623 RepID=UPI001FF731FC|nr:Mov34/MPN/PAD-1 family protein [Bradyrhizobium sp. 147]MCK1682188.1 Mov34/MPN/PAD-1 family protein [Bradyrhizobium sp. 147]